MLAVCWLFLALILRGSFFPPKKGKRGPGLWALACPMFGPMLDPDWHILSRCWAHVDVFWVYMGPMLGVSGPMLALCWPYVGFSWPSYCEALFSNEKRKKEPRPLGLSLPSVGPVLDPCWRILSRCWAHVVIFWVYVGPMLGVFGPKLAMLALCWPYVGFILALILWGVFFLRKKEPRPLGLTRGQMRARRWDRLLTPLV